MPSFISFREIANFFATEKAPDAVINFEASQKVKAQVANLIYREKTGALSANEKTELNHFLSLEHVIRLAKAHARTDIH